jgi:hypothetical protein
MERDLKVQKVLEPPHADGPVLDLFEALTS